MSLRKKLLQIGLATTLAFSPSCKKDEPSIDCICQGTIYPSEGRINSYEIGQGDSHELVEHCSFVYVNNHLGGYGDTLEEAGCSGLYLIWAYGSLQTINISPEDGSTLKTDKGFSFDRYTQPNLDKFINAHPDALLIDDLVPLGASLTDGGYGYSSSLVAILPGAIAYFNGYNEKKLGGMTLSRGTSPYGFEEIIKISKNMPKTPECDSTLYTIAKRPEELGIGELKLYMPRFHKALTEEGFEPHRRTVQIFPPPFLPYERIPEIEMPYYVWYAKCNEGIQLKWGFKGGSFGNSNYKGWEKDFLGSIIVKEGWIGKTDTGLVIGDSLEKFLQTYPNATPIKPNTSFPPYQEQDVWRYENLKARIKENKIDAFELDYEYNLLDRPIYDLPFIDK